MRKLLFLVLLVVSFSYGGKEYRTDFCQGFSEPIREMSDRCADLTDRIVQEFRHEGQLYSTGSRLRD